MPQTIRNRVDEVMYIPWPRTLPAYAENLEEQFDILNLGDHVVGELREYVK